MNNLCSQIDLQIGLFCIFAKCALPLTVQKYLISKFFDNNIFKSSAAENILKHFISGYFTKWVLVYFESFWVQGRFFPVKWHCTLLDNSFPEIFGTFHKNWYLILHKKDLIFLFSGCVISRKKNLLYIWILNRRWACKKRRKWHLLLLGWSKIRPKGLLQISPCTR